MRQIPDNGQPHDTQSPMTDSWTGVSNHERHKHMIGVLGNALLNFVMFISRRVPADAPQTAAGELLLPTAIMFRGLSEPQAIGPDTANALAEGNHTLREVDDYITGLRADIQNQEYRHAQQLAEKDQEMTAAASTGNRQLHDVRRERDEQIKITNQLRVGIAEALTFLNRGNANTRNARAVARLKRLGKEHNIIGSR